MSAFRRTADTHALKKLCFRHRDRKICCCLSLSNEGPASLLIFTELSAHTINLLPVAYLPTRCWMEGLLYIGPRRMLLREVPKHHLKRLYECMMHLSLTTLTVRPRVASRSGFSLGGCWLCFLGRWSLDIDVLNCLHGADCF